MLERKDVQTRPVCRMGMRVGVDEGLENEGGLYRKASPRNPGKRRSVPMHGQLRCRRGEGQLFPRSAMQSWPGSTA